MDEWEDESLLEPAVAPELAHLHSTEALRLAPKAESEMFNFQKKSWGQNTEFIELPLSSAL